MAVVTDNYEGLFGRIIHERRLNKRKSSNAQSTSTESDAERTELPFVDDDMLFYLTPAERIVLRKSCAIMPAADPVYIYKLIIEDGLNTIEILINSLFLNAYPTRKERSRKIYIQKRREHYLGMDGSPFDVEQFLQIYPDPEEFFTQKSDKKSELYRAHSIAFLPRHFKRLNVVFIKRVLSMYENCLYPTFKALDQAITERNFDPFCTLFCQLMNEEMCSFELMFICAMPMSLNSKKCGFIVNGNETERVIFKRLNEIGKEPEYPMEIDNVFYREVQYCIHEEQIKKWMRHEEERREVQVREAETNGMLKSCLICCNDQLLDDELVWCSNSEHSCCKRCLREYVNSKIEQGAHLIPCMDEGCKDGVYQISALEKVISPVVFQLLLKYISSNQQKSENLIVCYSCGHSVLAEHYPNQFVFECPNPICQRETCRKCGAECHVPLRCGENCDLEAKKRKYIEENMSKAVIRKCPKCSRGIIKESGCNMMTCSCSCKFCYVCNEKLDKNSYRHFQNSKCQQMTTMEEIHQLVAKKAGEQALNEFNEIHDRAKNLPTPDIDQLSGALCVLTILLVSTNHYVTSTEDWDLTEYNDRFIKYAFHHAAAAYAPDPHPCIRQYNTTGLSRLVLPCDFVDDTCLSYVARSGDWVVVAFRGTETYAQLVLELLTGMAPPGSKVLNGKVQKYFSSALDVLWNELLTILNILIEDQNPLKVVFTGHSLGGALASVASTKFAHLVKQRKLNIETILVTFGEPRVGNHEYARIHDELVPKSYRIVNKGDLVAHLPACWIDLKGKSCSKGLGIGPYHHGTEIWYMNGMNGMDEKSEYKICTGTPINEDEDCSNGYSEFGISDHMNYFGHRVSLYGIGGCQE